MESGPGKQAYSKTTQQRRSSWQKPKKTGKAKKAKTPSYARPRRASTKASKTTTTKTKKKKSKQKPPKVQLRNPRERAEKMNLRLSRKELALIAEVEQEFFHERGAKRSSMGKEQVAQQPELEEDQKHNEGSDVDRRGSRPMAHELTTFLRRHKHDDDRRQGFRAYLARKEQEFQRKREEPEPPIDPSLIADAWASAGPLPLSESDVDSGNEDDDDDTTLHVVAEDDEDESDEDAEALQLEQELDAEARSLGVAGLPSALPMALASRIADALAQAGLSTAAPPSPGTPAARARPSASASPPPDTSSQL